MSSDFFTRSCAHVQRVTGSYAVNCLMVGRPAVRAMERVSSWTISPGRGRRAGVQAVFAGLLPAFGELLV